MVLLLPSNKRSQSPPLTVQYHPDLSFHSNGPRPLRREMALPHTARTKWPPPATKTKGKARKPTTPIISTGPATVQAGKARPGHSCRSRPASAVKSAGSALGVIVTNTELHFLPLRCLLRGPGALTVGRHDCCAVRFHTRKILPSASPRRSDEGGVSAASYVCSERTIVLGGRGEAELLLSCGDRCWSVIDII